MAPPYRCVDCLDTVERCEPCRARRAAAQTERRARRRKARLCVMCSRPVARRGRKYLSRCEACTASNNTISGASHARALRAKRPDHHKGDRA